MNAVQTLEKDGCRLSYRVTGSGPGVVWIQGAGLHGDGWRPQVEALRGRYTSLTFDHRGVGLSGWSSEGMSIAGMARDVVALMDAAGWERAHLVGYSLGGMIAEEVALAAQGRVRSLSLINTWAHGWDVAKLAPSTMWTGIRALTGTRRSRRAAFLKIVLPDGMEPPEGEAERLAPLFGHDLAELPWAVLGEAWAMLRYDSRNRLRELAGVRTLVVGCGKDKLARVRYGRALAAGIPGARFVELSGDAHGVPLYAAEVITDLLAGFWDEEKER